MCGLDVTRKCIMTREQIAALAASRGSVQNAYGQMLQFYLDSPSYRGCDGAAVHDAATILYLLHPELFSGRKMQVEIDCSEGLNRGMTVCDMRRQRHKPPGRRAGTRRRKPPRISGSHPYISWQDMICKTDTHKTDTHKKGVSVTSRCTHVRDSCSAEGGFIRHMQTGVEGQSEHRMSGDPFIS